MTRLPAIEIARRVVSGQTAYVPAVVDMTAAAAMLLQDETATDHDVFDACRALAGTTDGQAFEVAFHDGLIQLALPDDCLDRLRLRMERLPGDEAEIVASVADDLIGQQAEVQQLRAVTLKPSGQQFKSLCPFHEEKQVAPNV